MKRTSEPNRRQFLGAAAAALVAPGLVPRSAEAGGPRIRANDQVALGLIGFGIRGRNLLRGSFLPNEGFRLLAVCDVDTTRREAGKALVDERYGNSDCATYVDYQELLARDDIDAVIIATPDHWHALQILHACQAGKDIYCEKPLTLTLHEAKTVIAAVRKHGRVFQTGSQQRSEYEHRFVTACELIRNGRIGRVLTANVGVSVAPRRCDLPEEEIEPGLDWDRWLGPAPQRPYHSDLSPRGMHGHYPSWRGYREYAGGYLADMGAHHFDIVQWALRADTSGPVAVVPPDDPDDEYGAWLEYEDGVRVTHGGPSGATFIGTDGLLHVDRGRLSSIPGDLVEKELEGRVEQLPRNAGHAANWLECLHDRGRPICDVEVGARSVAVCHLLNLAYWHHRPLTWDPRTWRFVGDPDANLWLDYQRREGYELPAV